MSDHWFGRGKSIASGPTCTRSAIAEILTTSAINRPLSKGENCQLPHRQRRHFLVQGRFHFNEPSHPPNRLLCGGCPAPVGLPRPPGATPGSRGDPDGAGGVPVVPRRATRARSPPVGSQPSATAISAAWSMRRWNTTSTSKRPPPISKPRIRHARSPAPRACLRSDSPPTLRELPAATGSSLKSSPNRNPRRRPHRPPPRPPSPPMGQPPRRRPAPRIPPCRCRAGALVAVARLARCR